MVSEELTFLTAMPMFFCSFFHEYLYHQNFYRWCHPVAQYLHSPQFIFGYSGFMPVTIITPKLIRVHFLHLLFIGFCFFYVFRNFFFFEKCQSSATLYVIVLNIFFLKTSLREVLREPSNKIFFVEYRNSCISNKY